MGIFPPQIGAFIESLSPYTRGSPHQTLKTHPQKASTMPPKRIGKKTGTKVGPSKSVPPEGPNSAGGEGSSSSHRNEEIRGPGETTPVAEFENLADIARDPHQAAQLLVELQR